MMKNIRINTIMIIILIFFVIVLARLIQIQIIDREIFVDNIKKQSEDTSEIIPIRGSIYDRNKNLLVFSEKIFRLYVDIPTLKDYLLDSLARVASSFTSKKKRLTYYKTLKELQKTEVILEKNFKPGKNFKSGLLTSAGFKLEKHNQNDGKPEYSILINLPQVKLNYIKYISGQLSSRTGADFNIYFNQLNNDAVRIAYLEKKLTQEVKDSIEALNITGIGFEEKSKRVYQMNSIASRLLGMVNNDGDGLAGIEMYHNMILKGKKGLNYELRDGNGKTITVLKEKSYPKVDGKDIHLTIDINYQQILEDELSKTVNSTSALNGIGIIMNPNNGEVLALANYPNFDPNNFNKTDTAIITNKVINDHYDPGSTFKSFTLAAALESGSLTPDDILFAENGAYQLGAHTIRDEHRFSNVSVRDALVYSSNIAFAKISHRLGTNVLYKYITNFGFGSKTGIELPNEKSGSLLPVSQRNRITDAFVAHGYSISVTPLQLITGYAALINGGNLYKPHIIKKIANRNNSVEDTVKPELIRRVISKEVSAQLRQIMREVVLRGTAKAVKFENIECGGKTGTASKHIDKAGYSKSAYYASFVGFYPIENPEFLCLIVIDSPKGSYYGGLVAAPVFRRVVERIFKNNEQLKSVETKIVFNNDSTGKKVPYVIGKDKETAVKILHDLGFIVSFENSGRFVSNQSFNEINQEVTLTLKDSAGKKKTTVVPNLIGLSLREAINTVKLSGLKFTISGSGYVKDQIPEPGTEASVGDLCTIILSAGEGR